MAKLIDYPTLKTPIPSGRKEEPLNKLKVEIDYSKSGVSYLTGDYYEGGVYAYLTPCRHENGVTGTFWDGKTHTMGYKILLKQMGRKSQKQIDIMADKILPYAQQIADLYSDGRHHDVVKLINDIITK
jgi:hypothetical protein